MSENDQLIEAFSNHACDARPADILHRRKTARRDCGNSAGRVVRADKMGRKPRGVDFFAHRVVLHKRELSPDCW